jgi:sulfhydrogenase subunit beta (sulfur reductase)
MGQPSIDRAGLDELFGALTRRGYTLVGPTVRDRAIVLDEVDATTDLPAGWTDVQDGATYRLARRGDDALFGHNAGPNS